MNFQQLFMPSYIVEAYFFEPADLAANDNHRIRGIAQ